VKVGESVAKLLPSIAKTWHMSASISATLSSHGVTVFLVRLFVAEIYGRNTTYIVAEIPSTRAIISCNIGTHFLPNCAQMVRQISCLLAV